MKEKTFWRILVFVVAAGVIATVSLTCYTIYLHNHCSILAYIASEGM